MFLDLRGVALRVGDRFERQFPVEVAPIMLGGSSYEVLVPSGCSVAVDRVAGGFLITVSLTAKVYGPCARCLGEAVFDIEAEEEEFVPTSTSGWEGADVSAFIEDMVVDVGGIAREAVVLSLPAQVVCSPSCLGLCPLCGQDLNRVACECEPIQRDIRWEKLKDIDLEV